jgi:hypothetical protein
MRTWLGARRPELDRWIPMRRLPPTPCACVRADEYDRSIEVEASHTTRGNSSVVWGLARGDNLSGLSGWQLAWTMVR